MMLKQKYYNYLVYIILCFIGTTSSVYADVLIKVNATLQAPTCNVTSDNKSILLIDFKTINLTEFDNANSNKLSKTFTINIEGCDVSSRTKLYLQSVQNGSYLIQRSTNKFGLNTSLTNLGVKFSQTNGELLSVTNAIASSDGLLLSEGQNSIDITATLQKVKSEVALVTGNFIASMTIVAIYN